MGVDLRIVGAGFCRRIIGVIRSQNRSSVISLGCFIAKLLRLLFEGGGVGFRLSKLLYEKQNFGREIGNVGFGKNAIGFNLEAVGEKEGFDDAYGLVRAESVFGCDQGDGILIVVF